MKSYLYNFSKWVAVVLLAIVAQVAAAETKQGVVEKVHVPLDAFLNMIRNSDKLCIGNLEIVNFPRASVAVTYAEPGTRGTKYHFSLQFKGSRSAKIYVYPNDIQLDLGVTDTCNISDAVHSKAVLSARIETAVVLGTLLVKADTILAISIPKLDRRNGKIRGGLSLDVTDAEPTIHRMYGGQIATSSGLSRIENPDSAVEVAESSANVLPGALRVRSTSASLSVDVGFTATHSGRERLDFRVVPSSFVEIRIPIGADQEASLTNGHMQAGTFSPQAEATNDEPSAVKVGNCRLEFATVSAASVALDIVESNFAMTFGNAVMSSVNAQYESQPTIKVSDVHSLGVRAITGDASTTLGGLNFVPAGLDAIEAKSDKIQVSSGPLMVSGPGALKIVRVDESGANGTISFSAAEATGLGGARKLAVFNDLTVAGMTKTAAASKPSYQGTVKGVVDELSMGRTIANGTATLDGLFDSAGDLPVVLKSTGPGGFMIMQTGADKGFEAALEDVSLSATFSPRQKILQVRPGGFRLDERDFKATGGRILGGVPEFSQGSLRMQNPANLILAAGGAEGYLQFTSQAFSIRNPATLDESKKLPLAFDGSLTSEVAVPIRAVLGTGEVFPISGTLRTASGIDLSLPQGIESVTVDVSGLSVELRSLKIAHFALTSAVTPPAITATATIASEGIEIGAKHISSADTPKFSGDVSQALEVASLSGTWRLAPAPIDFVGFEMKSANLAMSNLAYSTSDGISLSAATGSIAVDRFTDQYASGALQLSSVAIHIEGADTNGNASAKSVAFKFSGSRQDSAINQQMPFAADGRIDFDSLAFGVDTGMAIDSCGSNRLPIHVSGDTGALGGRFAISNGKTDFLLATNDLHFDLHRPISRWACEWDQKVVGVAFDVPCSDWCGGFIKYPCNFRMCRVAVDVNVRWQLTVWGVDASGILTQLKIEPDPGRGAKLCEGHLTQLNPPAFLPTGPAAHPTIPGGNVLSDAARAAIEASATAIEGPATQGLGLLGSLVSLTHIGNSIYLFGGC